MEPIPITIEQLLEIKGQLPDPEHWYWTRGDVRFRCCLLKGPTLSRSEYCKVPAITEAISIEITFAVDPTQFTPVWKPLNDLIIEKWHP